MADCLHTFKSSVEELVGERRGHEFNLCPLAHIRDYPLERFPHALGPLLLQRLNNIERERESCMYLTPFFCRCGGILFRRALRPIAYHSVQEILRGALWVSPLFKKYCVHRHYV